MAGIERNGIYIGSMRFRDRKKPCLVVERGNEAVLLGTFNNEKCVEEFDKALREILAR